MYVVYYGWVYVYVRVRMCGVCLCSVVIVCVWVGGWVHRTTLFLLPGGDGCLVPSSILFDGPPDATFG